MKKANDDLVKDWGRLVKENEELKRETLKNLTDKANLQYEIKTLLETIKIMNKHQG